MVLAEAMLDHRFDMLPPGAPGSVAAQPDNVLPYPPPVGREPMAETRAKYLRDWRIVKAARFNAAKRLERKQAASLIAFALAGTAGFVVPFFTLTFAEKLAPHTKSVLDFACYVSGALSLSVGLVEQARNYPALAARFHKCGLAVNSVLRRLRNARTPDEQLLNELSHAYEQALEDCDANHDDIDQAIAYAKDELDQLERQAASRPQIPAMRVEAARRKLSRLRLQEALGIYWLYTLVWLGPALLGLVVWIALAPATPQ